MSTTPRVSAALSLSTLCLAIAPFFVPWMASSAWAQSTAAPAAPAATSSTSQACAPVVRMSPTPPKGTLTLRFVGDIVMGNSHVVANIPKEWDSQYFAETQSYLKGASASIGNLEGALTEHPQTSKVTGTGRAYAFRSPPRYAQLLKEVGFQALSIANNHSNDFGAVGMADTLRSLEGAGIAAAGQKGRTEWLDVEGKKVAVLGFGLYPRHDRIHDIQAARERVRQARAQAHLVVVTYHAGAEGPQAVLHPDADELFLGENRGNTVAFSRAVIEEGADVVVGHGPHVLRSMECYRGRPIFHSLGNFIGVGGLNIRGPAAITGMGGVQWDGQGQIQAIEFLPLVFNDRKIPRPDSRDFGSLLVNWAGDNAQFKGQFLKVPTSSESAGDFAQWLKTWR